MTQDNPIQQDRHNIAAWLFAKAKARAEKGSFFAPSELIYFSQMIAQGTYELDAPQAKGEK